MRKEKNYFIYEKKKKKYKYSKDRWGKRIENLKRGGGSKVSFYKIGEAYMSKNRAK